MRQPDGLNKREKLDDAKKRKWTDGTQKWKQPKSANVDKHAKIVSEVAVAVVRAVIVAPQPVIVDASPNSSQQIEEVHILILMRHMRLGTVSTTPRR